MQEEVRSATHTHTQQCGQDANTDLNIIILCFKEPRCSRKIPGWSKAESLLGLSEFDAANLTFAELPHTLGASVGHTGTNKPKGLHLSTTRCVPTVLVVACICL